MQDATWNIEVHRRQRLTRLLQSCGPLEDRTSFREAEFWAQVRSLELLDQTLKAPRVLGYAINKVRTIPTRWGDETLFAMALPACAQWNQDLMVLFIARLDRSEKEKRHGRHGVIHCLGYCHVAERENEIRDVIIALA